MCRLTTLTLMKHKRRINARMLTAIKGMNADRDQAERKGMLSLIQHIYTTDIGERASLTGGTHEYTALHSRRIPEAAALAMSMADCCRWHVDCLRHLSTDELGLQVPYRRADGKMIQANSMLLAQVSEHDTRHSKSTGWLNNACGGRAPERAASISA